jgi:hypothetical protein
MVSRVLSSVGHALREKPAPVDIPRSFGVRIIPGDNRSRFFYALFFGEDLCVKSRIISMGLLGISLENWQLAF